MTKIFYLFLLLMGLLHADGCATKRFSLNAYQNHGASLTLMDLLRDVTQTCNISVVFEDKRARDRLSQPLDMVNIHDYTLPELLTFIFDQHNLFYDYNPQTALLKVSYYNTMSYNVDYINLETMTTTSSKSISVGSGGGAMGMNGAGGTGGGISGGMAGGIGGGISGGMAGGIGGGMGGGSNNDMTTVTATSSFTFWDELQNHIQEILKIDEDYNETYNKTLINRDATSITVSGTKRQLNEIEEYLAALKKRMHSQVMIEAQLIELTYNDYLSLGVNWSQFSLGLNSNFKSNHNNANSAETVYSFGMNFNSTGLIDFLKKYGTVEVLSNPKVLTLSNQPAVINVGQQLSYLYENGAIASANTQTAATTTKTLGSVFVGLTLNIVPEVTEDGYIIMRINPVTSELLTDSELSTSTTSTTNENRVMPPDTRVKQMTSIVKVKDSQKVLIGGLIEKKNFRNDTKVPLLGDIPGLGWLFHNKTDVTRKSELFILLTPRLIKGDVFPTIDDSVMKRFD
jgi:general secretion pathway protein D